MIFIDAHTHNLSQKDPKLVILDPLNLPNQTPDYFAIGIHPWFIEKLQISDLKELIEKYHCKILGECGLDRSIATSFELQLNIFKQQIELAKQYQIEHLIIHCVKAYSDILHILKVKDFKGKLLIHDYNGNEQILNQYLQHFDCYFSVGKKIFNQNTKISKSIQAIPLDRLLLETDDQSEKSIEEIYTKTSEVLKLGIQELSLQIEANFHQFLKPIHS